MVSVLFFSANSFLAAALQIRHNFVLMGLQPIVMNILFIAEFWLGIFFNMSPLWLTVFYIANAIAVFLISIVFYYYYFSFFMLPDVQTWRNAKKMVFKLIPCFFNMGLLELNTLIDLQFISFLPVGSIALFSYASAFMRIPLDLFATLFSNVTLPMLSKLTITRKKRLHFYLLETAKLFFWFCFPAMVFLIFFASDIFGTLLASVFTYEQQLIAGNLLIAASLGLFFFAINRNILNIYYVLHETLLPTLVSVLAIFINVVLNFLLIHYFGAVGVVLSTSIASMVQTIVLLYILHKKFKFTVYYKQFFIFALRYAAQSLLAFAAFYLLYSCILAMQLPAFFVQRWGLWLWVGPLMLLMMFFLYKTRKLFKVRLYFLEFH
jgi:putative peptidoglycan lipid II flippase